MKSKKKIIAAHIISLMVLVLTGCGKQAILTVVDDGVATEVDTKIPRTVEKILADGEIQIGENDVVEPDLSAKISEVQDIVITREHNVKLTTSEGTKDYAIVGGTVKDLLDEAGLKLSESQAVDFDYEDPLKDGMEVTIVDLKQVSITCDDETKDYYVEGPSVAEALQDAGITVTEDDQVTPDRGDTVVDGMEISVVRIQYETITEAVAINYEVVYEYDNSKAKGTETVKVAGENGEKEVTYKITYSNGEEINREVVEEVITKEPTTAVVVQGTYVAPAPSQSSSSSSQSSGGRTVVSKTPVYSCDGSGNIDYYEVKYSDGTTEYVEP